MTTFTIVRTAACLLAVQVLIACHGMPGPDPGESEFLPGPEGDVQKAVSGTWSSRCVSFVENDATLSERKTLALKPRSAVSRREVFASGDCTGRVMASETFTGALEVHSVLSPKKAGQSNTGQSNTGQSRIDALLEMRSEQAVDYTTYRIVLRTTITPTKLTTRTVRLSYWERGEEVWVPEEDLEPLPVTEYHRRL